MLKRLIPVFAALVTLGGVAAAQTKADPFDAHCADIALLQAKPVQTELKITAAQRSQMNQHATWHQSQLQAIDNDIKAKKIDPKKTDLRPRIAGLFEQLKGRVITVLTPTQLRRLREVTLQRVGDAALCDPVVAKRLGMSDAQLKKMQTTYTEGAKKFSTIEQEAAQKVLLPYKDKRVKDKAEADRLNKEVKAKLQVAAKQVQPKLNAIRADYAKRMKAILTSSQSKAFQALRGQPFRGV
jgi:hypothetical protein